MSLHTLAQHIQSAGRGNDTVLVHMTPKEVAGLQALAMAHGGSLTINPDTGLPEAGWLSKLLPMLAGFALNAFLPGVGTLIGETILGAGAAGAGALGSGLLVGGVTGLATGSLEKGLMAGLGAYGGAGLASGLASAGTSAANSAANAAANVGSTPANLGISASPQAASSFVAPAQTGLGSLPATVREGLNAFTGFAPETVAATTEPLISSAVPQAIGSSALSTAAQTGADAIAAAAPTQWDKIAAGAKGLMEPGGIANVYKALPTGTLTTLGTYALGSQDQPQLNDTVKQGPAFIRPYEYTLEKNPEAFGPTGAMYGTAPVSSAERRYFTPTWKELTPYKAPGPEYKKATGGIVALGIGGPIETMSAENAVGDNTMYPQSQLQTSMYSNPMTQRPVSSNVINMGIDTNVDPYTGEQRMAAGGVSHLGDYSDGGRLLKGPGDGVSDSIPAVIGDRQPARLADGEFVVPARIVSELGNGSTEAGARKLYAMMDRVQKARSKSTGKDKVAINSRAERFLPA